MLDRRDTVEIVEIVDVSPVMFLFTPVADLIKITDLPIFATIILGTSSLIKYIKGSRRAQRYQFCCLVESKESNSVYVIK